MILLTLDEIRARIETIVDPTLKKTLKETDGIKYIGLDEDKNMVVLIIAIGKTGTPEEHALRRELAKAVKIDLKFSGLKLEIEEFRVNASITKLPVNFIGIISGKGGVGKSSVAANLAYRLKGKGKKVALIDADIYGSSIPSIIESGDVKLYLNDEKKIIPYRKDGIEFISTEFFSDANKPVIWRGAMLNAMLNHFFYDVAWSRDLQYVVIDFPPGTGDIALDIKTIVPQAKMILITTPHPSASHVAIKAGLASKTFEHDLIGVVENMSYYINPITADKEFIFGEGGGEMVAKALDADLIARIPIGQPAHKLGIYEIDEPIGKIYDDLADFVIFHCAK
jgi:ATP-binding protein involved in chromosome partitioning